MKALITGITGCSGSYLAEYLLDRGFEVFGTKRKESSLKNIEHLTHKIKMFDIDLQDSKSIISILKNINPDQIYHLASANQFQDMNKIYETNVNGTVNFFESLAGISYQGRILIISSSAVYGIQESISPLNEKSELSASGHYGLSKVFQENIANYYYKNHNLDIIISRPFNFTGPREYPSYVCTDFARQIVDIEQGRKEPVIKVGNLQNKRDFTDVRDMVRGYGLLLEKGIKGEIYNLSSGSVHSISTILDILLALSTAQIEIQVNQLRIKEGKVNFQMGDSSKILSQTGWEPQISLDKTLEDVIIYNRKY